MQILMPMLAVLLTLPQLLEGADGICFEAEEAQAVSAPVEVIRTTTAAPASPAGGPGETSQRAYLEIAQGKGNPPGMTDGDAQYTFDLNASGTYYLWCRVWWGDECGNSMTMTLNDGHPFTFGQDATYKAWHWVKAPPRIKDLKMKSGRHTLKINNREDGIRVDQILLTSKRRFVPVGIEKSTPLPKAAASKDDDKQ